MRRFLMTFFATFRIVRRYCATCIGCCPGGRLLFSDALVISGLITNEEVAVRSSIGLYVFTISPA